MADCKHDFMMVVGTDVGGAHQASKPLLQCRNCGVLVQRKGGEPRYTLNDIPRNQFIVNCILDSQLIASHLNGRGELVDDRNRVVATLDASYMQSVSRDRGAWIAAMVEKLQSMVCMSCEREVETWGGICHGCARMVLATCVSCDGELEEGGSGLCGKCQIRVNEQLAKWSLDA